MHQRLSVLLVSIVILASLAGCSNRAMYSALQNNKINDCYKLPDSQVDECLASASESFDEYEKKKNEK